MNKKDNFRKNKEIIMGSYQISQRWLDKNPRFISAMYQYIKRFGVTDYPYTKKNLAGMLAFDSIYDIDSEGQEIRKEGEANFEIMYKEVESFVKYHNIKQKAYALWRRSD